MEPRQMLAADILLGSVYFEEAAGDDTAGDVIQVTFAGGAEGTTLDHLVIDADKTGDGLSAGDVFFDTSTGGLGAFGAVGMQILAHDGFTILGFHVVDGGSQIVFDFHGFDPGELLEFSIDADEIQFVDPSIVSGSNVDPSGIDTNALVEGAEFQRSILTGHFSAPRYEDMTLEALYWDLYDVRFDQAAAEAGSTLNMPPDAYDPEHDFSDRTAGAIVHAGQTLLPTIAGTVFHDVNLNNQQEFPGDADYVGDAGIANVELSLWVWDDAAGAYRDTGMRTLTDAHGDYLFVDDGGSGAAATIPLFSGDLTISSRAGSEDRRGVEVRIREETRIPAAHPEVEFDPVARVLSITVSSSALTHFAHINEALADIGFTAASPVIDGFYDPALDNEATAVMSGGTRRLLPGRYQVREAQPSPYFSVGAKAGTIDGTTEGVVLSPDVISEIDLPARKHSVDNDFAEALPATIQGRVHLNTDGDCDFEEHDILLEGVQVDLLDANGDLLATTHTDANGEYRFTNLAPGTYQVREHTPESYEGRPVFDGGEQVGTAGGQIAGNDRISGIRPVPGTTARDYNFCEHVGATLSGWVYHDESNEGDFDADEDGIGNAVVELLDADGNPTGITTTTSSDGYYEFVDLAPGTWGVREFTPDGYLDGLDKAGTHGGSAQNPGDRIASALLGFADHAENYNFGELLPSTIRGRVHLNLDGNCELNPNDVLLEGVRVDLLDVDGNVLATTQSDDNGEYRFDGLRPGEYQVREQTPATYDGRPVYDGAERVGTAGGEIAENDVIRQIVLTSGTDARDYDFCEHIGAVISGWVYHDVDNDGLFDPGEDGISAVVVELLDENGIATGITTTTSTEPGLVGYYEFTDLAPGTWGVREFTPSLYLDGRDTAGTHGGSAHNPGDSITGAELGFAAFGREYNFGELLPSSISGRVHANADGDCDFEPADGDFAIEGVRIDLLDSDGELLETQYTNANGEYQFDRLPPGEYEVVEHQPDEFNGLRIYDGDEHVGTAGGEIVQNDRIRRIELTSGTTAERYDFCEQVGVSLSGWVYHDADNDGVIDPGEEGIGGVTLKLLDANGNDTGLRAVTSTTPGREGYYEFTGLAAGTYGVMEVHPPEWLDGIDTPGNRGGVAEPSPPGDMIAGAVLEFGRSGADYNFGELLPGSIRGSVHLTNDPNCEVNEFATPLEDIQIDLLDEDGNVLKTTTTDAAGAYQFTGLRPGRYTVHEHQPVEYFDGGNAVGSGGGSRLDKNTIADVEIHSGQRLVDYNFCEHPAGSISGYVFQDGAAILSNAALPDDISGIRDGARTPDDTPISGVVLELRQGRSGDPIFGYQALPGLYAFGKPIRTVTDENGFYEFVGLPAGTYAVVEIQPGEFIDGIDTQGSSGGHAVNPPVHPTLEASTIPELGTQIIIDQFRTQFGNDAIVMIPLPSGQHSVENNFSEVVTEPFWLPPEPPPPQPPPLIRPPIDPFMLENSLPQLASPEPVVPFIGSSARGLGYTWHLSVVNAGFPRAVRSGETIAQYASAHWDAQAWQGADMSNATWTLAESDGNRPVRYDSVIFGNPDGVPVVGDWDGDGVSEIGVFLDGEWFLDVNGNGVWDEEDLWAKLGATGDLPVTGDWDGDGKTDIGIFGPTWPGDPRAIVHEPGLPDPENIPIGKAKNVPPPEDEATLGTRTMKYTSRGRLRADLIDHVFQYGRKGDVPVVGDWNGDGIATIGVFRGGVWYIDANGDGRYASSEETHEFGRGGDIPVVGDFNGDGMDDLGVFRAGRWIVDSDGDRRLTAQDRVFEFGAAGDLPAVGDWNGDGTDDPAVYHPGTERVFLGQKAQ